MPTYALDIHADESVHEFTVTLDIPASISFILRTAGDGRYDNSEVLQTVNADQSAWAAYIDDVYQPTINYTLDKGDVTIVLRRKKYISIRSTNGVLTSASFSPQ